MELKQALEGSDLADIRAKTEALNEAAQPLAQAVYAQASEAASAPGGANGGSSGEDEVVEDADYEVIDDDEAATKA